MKKIDLPLIMDVAFVFLSALFVSFTILRFYISFLNTLIISILISTLLALVMFKLFYKKYSGTLLIKNDASLKKEIFFNLPVQSDSKLIKYFSKLFTKAQISSEIKNNKIFLTVQKRYIIFRFKQTPLTADDLTKILKKHAGKSIIVLTDEISGDVSLIADKTDTKIVCGNDLFIFMKKHDLFPETQYKLTSKQKKSLKNFSSYMTRKKAKNFLFFGIMLLIYSIFVPFPIYYLVMGNILIITSLILRFYGKRPDTAHSVF